MVKYLLQRPIAVIMSFVALAIIGLVVIWKIPVSLLPSVDVPVIVIKVNYSNSAAATLEKNILRPIRENAININHIKNIESRAANHIGLVYLTFEHGTKMDLAYIEVNEKLDRLTNNFPRDMHRPQVMRINTSDIPVVRIQVIPKKETDFLQTGALTEKILRKRLEQIDGVSLVDISGRQQGVITIIPDKEQLMALGVNEDILTQSIQDANKDIGGLNVKDGQYRYFVSVNNSLTSAEEISQLPVSIGDGRILLLGRLAKISFEPEKPTGYHLYNGKQGIVITVQKQSESRMNELVPEIEKVTEQFKKDYPRVDFALTQDQTFLLDAGISNLYQDLIYGGILTILLLFLFLGNIASPALMSISIPLSLIITFIFFYLFNISFNIISLSGLALGIGMLIDNSIVVVDSIDRKRRTGMKMADCEVDGTNEVITPVISQVLTTVAVYAPLVLLSGIGGALVFDQSIALTISLGVSLVVAFVLTPLLYKLFLKASPDKLKEDTIFYKWVSKAYHRMIDHILRHKLFYFVVTILLMPVGIWLATDIPLSSLPRIEKKESLVYIDWNAPIDANENLERTKTLQQYIQKDCAVTEAEIGLKQFLLQNENSTIQKTEIYFSCINENTKLQQDNKVKAWLNKNHPDASYYIMDAPNAFTQLFSTNTPYLEARFKPIVNDGGNDAWQPLEGILKQMSNLDFKRGEGLMTERSIDILLDQQKMLLYGVSRSSIENKLQQLFGSYTVTEIKRFGDINTIRLKTDADNIDAQFASLIQGNKNAYYPLSSFTSLLYTEQPKFITADKTGEYKSIVFENPISHINRAQDQIRNFALQNGYRVDFTGQYYENKTNIRQLWVIFFIVLALLYLILAIQYESLIQPLLVMLTIPLGITGGMFLLWITNGSLDIMAAIGFVVILGLIVDDPILKIETLNRLEKKYLAQGFKKDDHLMKRMIHEAGDMCLKPLLLVSLTTSIALVPVLFISGIGNDLQRPLAIVIIGGLTIGTFFTTWFIPLAYWYVNKWRKR
jgi:multidrug efflux pump subunit AcrB